MEEYDNDEEAVLSIRRKLGQKLPATVNGFAARVSSTSFISSNDIKACVPNDMAPWYQLIQHPKIDWNELWKVC